MSERLETYGLATIGALQGLVRYYVLTPMVEQWDRLIDKYVPPQVELDQMISEGFTESWPQGD